MRILAIKKSTGASHREAFSIYDHDWALRHPDLVKAKSQTQYKKRKTSGYIESWLAAHPEKVAEYKRRAKVKGHEYVKKYHSTPKGRATVNRFTSKRRELGTIDFYRNEPFPGAHLHHVELGIGIYIPITLHRSIRHNLKTGEGMVQIQPSGLRLVGH